MYLGYSIVYALALLLSSPYWALGMLRAGKYRAGLKDRFGILPARLSLPAEKQKAIWVHAVSVGEVLAVSGLVSLLNQESPDAAILVSTTTLTGQKLARERFGEDRVFYLPLDLPFAVRRFLRAIRPAMLIIAETEFWPNLLHEARSSAVRVAVVNARISDRSLPGYKRFRWLLRPVLRNVDIFLAQTELDRERLISIGAASERVQVGGNLKFDIKPPSESALSQALRRSIGQNQPTLVFGSTVEGEEQLLVPCFKSVLRDYPQALIVLAPRHPERFDAVAELLRSSGISFCRRSAWNPAPLPGGVFLLDTIGELASVYSIANIAFVGGSLVARGGHNILEPAQFAKPILIGPHYENFRDIVHSFLAANAVLVTTPEQISGLVLRLLQVPKEALRLGSRGWQVVEGGRGSTQRTLQALREVMTGETPASTPGRHRA
jgi:3-deoxy-D-manno-octulosonic-acid transferase